MLIYGANILVKVMYMRKLLLSKTTVYIPIYITYNIQMQNIKERKFAT